MTGRSTRASNGSSDIATLLVVEGDRGQVRGYLLAYVHDTFFANGPVA
jgi:hypothetical protein